MVSQAFTMDLREMAAKTAALPEVIEGGVAAVLAYHEPQVSSYAKTYAPWNDQTGNARNGLDAKVYRDGSKQGIVLFHQVAYGIWLEVRWDGRYATIVPTILNQGPEVMRSLEGLLGRL